MANFTNQRKFEEARREVSMRRSVYARRVVANQMRQETADEFIAIMQEIADEYFEKACAEQKTGGLFAGQ